MNFKYNEEKEFFKILSPIINNYNVQLMKSFKQHGGTSTFEHCKHISELCFLINRRLKLNCNEIALVQGAMLHDFYLYDWHNSNNPSRGKHGFVHPLIATRNAKRCFNIDKKIENIILSHMWPLTITKIPKSKEAWIVSCVDKYSSIQEIYRNFYKKMQEKCKNFSLKIHTSSIDNSK